MRKLTKADLEKLAKEIIAWADEYELGHDWLLFYNGKKYDPKESVIEENVNPVDFCVYFPEKFIMGMAYDGTMYEIMNDYFGYSIFEKLEKILDKYGLYLEHADSCHACMCEAESDMEVEYSIFKKPKEYNLIRPGYCYERWSNEIVDYPKVLDYVMNFWRDISSRGYHGGYCIIGEGIEFDLEGRHYNMSSQCMYQGITHFLETANVVADALKYITGISNIRINEGRID